MTKERKRPAFTSWQLLLPTCSGQGTEMMAQFSRPSRGSAMRTSGLSRLLRGSCTRSMPIWC